MPVATTVSDVRSPSSHPWIRPSTIEVEEDLRSQGHDASVVRLFNAYPMYTQVEDLVQGRSGFVATILCVVSVSVAFGVILAQNSMPVTRVRHAPSMTVAAFHGNKSDADVSQLVCFCDEPAINPWHLSSSTATDPDVDPSEQSVNVNSQLFCDALFKQPSAYWKGGVASLYDCDGCTPATNPYYINQLQPASSYIPSVVPTAWGVTTVAVTQTQGGWSSLLLDSNVLYADLLPSLTSYFDAMTNWTSSACQELDENLKATDSTLGLTDRFQSGNIISGVLLSPAQLGTALRSLLFDVGRGSRLPVTVSTVHVGLETEYLLNIQTDFAKKETWELPSLRFTTRSLSNEPIVGVATAQRSFCQETECKTRATIIDVMAQCFPYGPRGYCPSKPPNGGATEDAFVAATRYCDSTCDYRCPFMPAPKSFALDISFSTNSTSYPTLLQVPCPIQWAPIAGALQSFSPNLFEECDLPPGLTKESAPQCASCLESKCELAAARDGAFTAPVWQPWTLTSWSTIRFSYDRYLSGCNPTSCTWVEDNVRPTMSSLFVMALGVFGGLVIGISLICRCCARTALPYLLSKHYQCSRNEERTVPSPDLETDAL